MALDFLPAAVAREQLIAVGMYNDETAPSEAALELVLTSIEIFIEQWLDFRIVATEYPREQMVCNRKGFLLTSYFPIVSLNKVTIIAPYGNAPALEVSGDQCIPLLRGDRSIFVGPRYAGFRCIVSYTAGLLPDEIPRIFPQVVFQILSRVLTKSGVTGDLSFLNEPTKDTASISLPGGLSKSYQLGKAGGSGNAAGGTEADRLLSGLAQYRRMFVT